MHSSGTGVSPVSSGSHGQDAHATFQPDLIDLSGRQVKGWINKLIWGARCKPHRVPEKEPHLFTGLAGTTAVFILLRQAAARPKALSPSSARLRRDASNSS